MRAIEVRDSSPRSVDQALTILKRKLSKEGVFRAIHRHAYYLKPSDRRKVKQATARRRREKAEKHYQAQFDGHRGAAALARRGLLA
jgi:small subunit ribosomal protein S21